VSYEGQAAVELEQCADESEQERYRFSLSHESDSWVYDWRPVVRAILTDRAAGVPAGVISMRFHRALAALIADAADIHRRETGCDAVALSGGCFQNELLLALGNEALRARGFTVLINRLVPCNDGGISYGQAAFAAASTV
jgi:hydrogenase maturation protein HypF